MRINPTEKKYQLSEALLAQSHLFRKTIDLVFSTANGLNRRKVNKNTFIVLGSLLALISGCSTIDQHQPDSVKEHWEKIYIHPQSSIKIKYNEELEQELLAHRRLFTKNPSSNYYKVKMPRRIQDKLITPWMIKHHLFKAFYRNRADIKKASKNHEIIKLSYLGNHYYRCRTVGLRQIQKDKAVGINTKVLGTQNHPDYLYVKPSTAKMINQINQLLNKELHKKFGFSTQYRIRLIVNSGIRDTEYNQNFSSSSPNSTHQLGIAVDFSTNGFDVIKNKTKNFIYLSNKKGRSVEKKHRVRYKATQALKFVLVKLHKAGKLFAIKERGHYHITDKAGMP